MKNVLTLAHVVLYFDFSIINVVNYVAIVVKFYFIRKSKFKQQLNHVKTHFLLNIK